MSSHFQSTGPAWFRYLGFGIICASFVLIIINIALGEHLNDIQTVGVDLLGLGIFVVGTAVIAATGGFGRKQEALRTRVYSMLEVNILYLLYCFVHVSVRSDSDFLFLCAEILLFAVLTQGIIRAHLRGSCE